MIAPRARAPQRDSCAIKMMREDPRDMFFFRRKRVFKTIDADEEAAILKLAREHPEMGRRRFEKLVAEHGIEVDSFQIKKFLRSHDIGTPPPTRQVPLPGGPTGVASGWAK